MNPFLVLSALLIGFAASIAFARYWLHPTLWNTKLNYRVVLILRNLVATSSLDSSIVPKFSQEFQKKYRSLVLFLLSGSALFALFAHSMGAFRDEQNIAFFICTVLTLLVMNPYLYWRMFRKDAETGMRVLVTFATLSWWRIFLMPVVTIIHSLIWIVLLIIFYSAVIKVFA